MSWRVAESLEVLRRQLNEAFPNRSKASDGGIGDARHQASSSSDHNPHIKLKSVGIVTARDFTHDPKNGIDCNWLAKVLVKNKDPRIKYIIWNKQICSSKTSPWKWRPYSGVNAHTKHLHLSVMGTVKLYDSTAPWDLDLETDDIAKIEIPATTANKTAREVTTAPPVSFTAPLGTSADASSDTSNEVTNIPVPAPDTMPQQQNEVAVQVVSTPPDPNADAPKEDTITKIGNRFSALWTAAGAAILAAGSWLTSTPTGIAVAIIGAIVLVGVGYMAINALRATAKERRDAEKQKREDELKAERERRDHEIQLRLIEINADTTKNNITLVPPPVVLPNSDSPEAK